MAILTQEKEEISGGFLLSDRIPKPLEHYSGVYKITCTLTSKVYVGSSSNCVYRRLSYHRTQLRKGTHHSIKLQRAYKKYGESNFYLEILELCSASECIVKEQFWMDNLKSADSKQGYNIAEKAGSNLGIKYSITRKHPGHSIEVRNKLSIALKGKPKSKEHSFKSGIGHKIPVIQLTLSNKFIKEWGSAKDAALFLKVKNGNKISSCCRKTPGYLTFKGYKWVYKKDYYGNINTGNK